VDPKASAAAAAVSAHMASENQNIFIMFNMGCSPGVDTRRRIGFDALGRMNTDKNNRIFTIKPLFSPF
jgi:hypothetical protein